MQPARYVVPFVLFCVLFMLCGVWVYDFPTDFVLCFVLYCQFDGG